HGAVAGTAQPQPPSPGGPAPPPPPAELELAAAPFAPVLELPAGIDCMHAPPSQVPPGHGVPSGGGAPPHFPPAHVPGAMHAVPPHDSPSKNPPGIVMHAAVSVLHSLGNAQSGVAQSFAPCPTHSPPMQVSVMVQALPSSQAAP